MNTNQSLRANATVQAQALRMSSVCDKTGLSRAQIYKLVRSGLFPAPYKLTERVSAWSEQEVSDWLAAKFARVDSHA